MQKRSETALTIRFARREDVPEVVAMVRELAEFEKLLDQMVATEIDYEEAIFGERPAAEALVAETDAGLIGYAIFFPTFSTFVGKAGIWLEDLYVRPADRRRGVGMALLREVGRIAETRNAGRYEWCVLDWNRDAIDLYTRVGGKILEEWRIVRMEREGIRNLQDI